MISRYDNSVAIISINWLLNQGFSLSCYVKGPDFRVVVDPFVLLKWLFVRKQSCGLNRRNNGRPDVMPLNSCSLSYTFILRPVLRIQFSTRDSLFVWNELTRMCCRFQILFNFFPFDFLLSCSLGHKLLRACSGEKI